MASYHFGVYVRYVCLVKKYCTKTKKMFINLYPTLCMTLASVFALEVDASAVVPCV